MSKPRLKVTPLGDLVLIEEKSITEMNGIVLPEKAQQYTWTVVAAGPDAKRAPVGSRVLTRPNSAVTIADYSAKRILFHDEDIIALVDDLPPEEQPSNLVLL